MTSEVLTVCRQLVLTAFRYPNLSEIIYGPKKGKNIPLYHQDRTTGHSNSGQAPHLMFIQEGWISFPLPTYNINPRAKRGSGGLLCYVHRSIEEGVVHLSDLNSSEDRIWFKLKSYFLAFLKICTFVLYTYLPQNQLIWLLGIIFGICWRRKLLIIRIRATFCY